MSSDNHDDFPAASASYEDVWKTPDVREVLRRHFTEQLQAGIFDTYNDEVAHTIAEYGAYNPKDVEGLIRKATSAELLLLIAADTGGDIEGQTITFASPVALVRVDPRTGKSLEGSFQSVAQVEQGVVSHLNSGFTREQAELLLRQGNEQITVGLHPELIYNADYIG